MLNRSASLAMSTSIHKALSGKLNTKDTHLVFSFYIFRFKMKVGCDIEDDKRRAKRIRETIGFDKILV